MNELCIKSRTAAAHGWDTFVTPERAGWTYSGVRTAAVGAGETFAFDLNDDEGIIVPLAGSFRIEVDGEGEWTLKGRPDVFSSATDVLYVPVRSRIEVTASQGGRFAVATARASRRHPVQYVSADDVPVFVRGRGPWAREIRDFGNSSVIQAEHVIAVEVINPGGNWSGIPRHKHDVAGEAESKLEEIYFFEPAPTPGGPGYGLMRISGSEAGEIDLTEEVRSGDVVLVPFGWHGPVTAPPESDLYYLNVMAGPTGRTWNVTNHPEDTWVLERWQTLAAGAEA